MVKLSSAKIRTYGARNQKWRPLFHANIPQKRESGSFQLSKGPIWGHFKASVGLFGLKTKHILTHTSFFRDFLADSPSSDDSPVVYLEENSKLDFAERCKFEKIQIEFDSLTPIADRVLRVLNEY